MSLFENLAKIVTAPIKIIDKAVLEPIAEVAEDVVEGWTGDTSAGKR